MKLLKILKFDKKLLIFFVWVCFGIGFSMSVILSTIGLMEGFERDLLFGLNKVNGDFIISESLSDEQLKKLTKALKNNFPSLTYRTFIKHQVFLVSDQKESKGVILLGASYNESVGLLTEYGESLDVGEMNIGEDLANELGVKLGDRLQVLLPSVGNSNYKIQIFKIKSFFKTNLYEKDSRMAIINNESLPIDLMSQKNFFIFNFNSPFLPMEEQKIRIRQVNDLLTDSKMKFYATPYWDEFSTLIEAVEIEKISILLVLQIIVIVSVFNLLSFLIFFREKKIKEIFTLNAIGLSPGKIQLIWFNLSLILWFFSMIISFILVRLFSIVLIFISEKVMPKSIYHLGRINLYLSTDNYMMVFAIGLFWILLMTYFLTRKFRKESPLSGLRQQYT